LCFVLAVRGLRLSEGKVAGGLRQTLTDVLTGLLIAAPVYWLFSKLLAINLPGLTQTGWL
jgi:putative tricarboxylic transport membrane protein